MVYLQSNESSWGSMVELASISSEQLSDAYRRTIIPTWPPSPEPEEDFQSIVAQAKPMKGKHNIPSHISTFYSISDGSSLELSELPIHNNAFCVTFPDVSSPI